MITRALSKIKSSSVVNNGKWNNNLNKKAAMKNEKCDLKNVGPKIYIHKCWGKSGNNLNCH